MSVEARFDKLLAEVNFFNIPELQIQVSDPLFSFSWIYRIILFFSVVYSI